MFHPIKYLKAIKNICVNNYIDVYEKTKVLSINKEKDTYTVATDTNIIKAKKVVVATHYPFFILPFFMPLKTCIEKSYIIAGKIKEIKDKTYITSSSPTKSLRYHRDKDNNYIIYVSNSHKICNNLNEEHNYQSISKEGKKLNINIDYIWSNDDIITADKYPILVK